MIATERNPTGGDARVLGHSVTREPRWVQQRLGVVPQEISLYPKLTAAENVRFFGQMFEVPRAELSARVEELLDRVGLLPRSNDPVDTFSGGMKRRLNLVVSLVHRPQVILLDEPTVGVDPQSRENIFGLVRSIKDAGAAVLYTTHYMEEAERLCDRIGIMDAGEIIASGTLDALTEDGKMSLEELFFERTGRSLRD
jgi:ABC-2 type transport system ATP-binding protein